SSGEIAPSSDHIRIRRKTGPTCRSARGSPSISTSKTKIGAIENGIGFGCAARPWRSGLVALFDRAGGRIDHLLDDVEIGRGHGNGLRKGRHRAAVRKRENHLQGTGWPRNGPRAWLPELGAGLYVLRRRRR